MIDYTSCLGVDPDMKTPAFACVKVVNTPMTTGGVMYELLYCGVGRVAREKKELNREAEMPRRVVGAFAAALAGVPNRPFSPVIVEGQKIYQGVPVDPNDICRLAQCAGAILGFLQAIGHWCHMPSPHEWKGSVPKHVPLVRAYKKLRLAYERVSDYAVPVFLDNLAANVNYAGPAVKLNKGDWKHVGDAVALAIWGLENKPWEGAK